MDFSPRSVLIVGASRGIGRATAEHFQRQGHRVAGTHRGSGVPEGVFPVQADISRPLEIAQAFTQVAEHQGPVETLIVASGITDDDVFLRMSEEKFRRVIEIDGIRPVLLVKEGLRQLLRSKDGSVVFVSSISGRGGVPGQVNYTAAKALLEGATRSLAREYGKKGLRVNIVAPGATETDMTRALTEEQRAALGETIPMGRFARPEEIASVVYWVSQSTYMTGATVPVAGGAGMGL